MTVGAVPCSFSASQRLRRIEIGAGNFYAEGCELAEKARSHPGRDEIALHGAVRRRAGTDIFVDLLHLDDVAFEARDLGDAHDLALAVGEARQLHDDADGG